MSDEPNNPRKWVFPAGTTIPANGYLLVWANEDGTATSGLHASFKLSGLGEQIFLTDTDANLNAVLDSVEFGAQETDRSFGRTANDAELAFIRNRQARLSASVDLMKALGGGWSAEAPSKP